jgi:hypothetical protein
MSKSCKNCGHRKFDKCEHPEGNNYYCSTERSYPSNCGSNYELWWTERDTILKFVKRKAKLLIDIL